ncbi:hypothetical protein P691DRAFT_807775 [Macrolepiota fuliginosa MF-IS2]|uniref:Uncharacterized protein n=1 Tax=Macrolepiota fuliginosa MF-IS2 TaxID=1400762 RepID=A0A9P5XIC2_9AGAR|nr:hypothetical protein P691DRAFT_807775 [Macrolepiota fuliginosa MF-IS2]
MPPSQDLSRCRLPQEIVHVIIHQAKDNRTTLYNLCLVSTSFLHEAQRSLYHNLNITDDIFAFCSGWTIDFDGAKTLLITLTEHNTALAEHVHSLYHRLTNVDHYNNEAHWKLFARSLQLMSNLKRLIVTCSHPTTDYLAEYPFRRLEVFACDRSCGDPITYKDTMHLLSTQPHLKSIYVWDLFHNNEPFPEDCCLNLEALTGDRRTIESILPGRSVTKLTWIPASGEDGVSIPRTIISELSNIRIFSLGGYYDRSSFHLLIPYLPSLEVLRLFGKSPGVELSVEFELIPKLPNLRVFIWTAGFATSVKGWGCFDNESGVDTQRSWVKDWFSKSRSLEVAYFHSRQPEPTPQRYLCWKRDEDGPALVDAEEAVASHGVVSWYS